MRIDDVVADVALDLRRMSVDGWQRGSSVVDAERVAWAVAHHERHSRRIVSEQVIDLIKSHDMLCHEKFRKINEVVRNNYFEFLACFLANDLSFLGVITAPPQSTTRRAVVKYLA